MEVLSSVHMRPSNNAHFSCIRTQRYLWGRFSFKIAWSNTKANTFIQLHFIYNNLLYECVRNDLMHFHIFPRILICFSLHGLMHCCDCLCVFFRIFHWIVQCSMFKPCMRSALITFSKLVFNSCFGSSHH